MFRTKLTLVGLAVAAAISGQTAVAQAKVHGSSNPSFITDTLAPGGRHQNYPFVTAAAHGYRFTTDTLAPGGGTSALSAPAATGFGCAAAGMGAGGMAGIVLALLRTARVGRRRSVIAV